MSNQIADTLQHTFYLDPPLFEDAEKISTTITRDDKDHIYKMYMPKCGVGLNLMTRHIHEFTRKSEALEIPDDHGKARFSLFRNSLANAAPSSGWEAVTKDLADNDQRTQQRFKDAGKAWIARVSIPNDRNDQILWMRTVQKGPNMTSELFDSNLRLTNDLTDWLPGNKDILTEDELKTTFFNGMPHAWKAQYRAAGLNAEEATHASILAYMRGAERESNNKASRNMQKQAHNGSSSNTSRHRNGGRNPTNGGRGRGHTDRYRGRSFNNLTS
jgi:hypothetical protein